MMVTWLRRSPRDREIARLAVPALGALAAEPLYLLVDTAIVGHLGTDQLSGLAIVGMVLTALCVLMLARLVGMGCAVRPGRLAGHRREPPRLNRRRRSPPALHAAPGRGFLCR